MKILYTATVLSHICQFHLPYLKMLREQGHEVHVAAHDNLAEKNGLRLQHADKFIEIPFARSPASPSNLKAYRQLKRLIDSEHYDVILCNTPMGGIVTRLAAKKARRRGTRVIYMAHGFHFYKGASKKSWLIYYPIEKYMARHCDVLVTINEEDYALAKAKFKNVRVEHIHGIGVSNERYHPATAAERAAMRRAEGLADSDFAILCTGELNANKDQKTLIFAAAKIKEKLPGLKILLAGNGPMENELREQIQELGLENTVKLLGYRTDLEKVAPAMDLVVSCSRREGLPLNIIEAMLCQRALVVSDNRGHRELIEDGVNGYLVGAGDIDAFTNRIVRLAKDAPLAEKMGEAGYEKAQKYTVSAVKEEIKTIIVRGNDMQKIPKMIHYCWFGGNPKPQLVLDCIESWKKFCPDYEIREWNEESFDVSSVPFTAEAYECKKWAFVSDYVRLYALGEYGGIYLDTDVRLFKPMDTFLDNDMFWGFEANDMVMTAVFGARPGHGIILELIGQYNKKHFIQPDGTMDTWPNPYLITRVLSEKGLKLNGRRQQVDGFVVFPQHYFGANNISRVWGKTSKRSYAVHFCDQSWCDTKKGASLFGRVRQYIVGILRNLLGTYRTYKLSCFFKGVKP